MFNQKIQKKFQTLLLALIAGNFAMSPVLAQVTADKIESPKLFDKIMGDKHPVIDPQLESWFLSKGVKAVIFTPDDPGKTITIDSDGQGITFHNCECNKTPNCPPLLEPYYPKFTPAEILTRTSTFKGKERYILEIGAGILFLAAPNIPGVPSELGSVLSGLGLLGSQINPQAKAQQELQINHVADEFIKNALVGVDTHTNPVVVIQMNGKFDDMVASYRTFLQGLGSKEVQSQISKDAIQYNQDLQNGLVPKDKQLLTCEEQALAKDDEILANQAAIEKQNEEIHETEQEILNRLPAPAAPAQPNSVPFLN